MVHFSAYYTKVQTLRICQSVGRCIPLNGPGHSDGKVLARAQHLYQIGPARRTDGPQRVGAALELSDDQVVRHVAL